jgi:hypothetical protein
MKLAHVARAIGKPLSAGHTVAVIKRLQEVACIAPCEVERAIAQKLVKALKETLD